MRTLFIPTRGSDRLLRKERIWRIAEQVDKVLVIARDFVFPKGTIPPNVEVIYDENLRLGEKRNIGTHWGFEQGAEWTWQCDDDLLGDYKQIFEEQDTAMRKYPFLGSIRALSAISLFHYGHKRGEEYNGLFDPRVCLYYFPASLYALRKQAFLETEGFHPYPFIEDRELGTQMCARGWPQGYIPRAAYTTDRAPYNPVARQAAGGGGIPPEERAASAPFGSEFVMQRALGVVKSATPAKTPFGTPQLMIRLDWKEYAKRCWARWGGEYPEEMRELLGKHLKEE